MLPDLPVKHQHLASDPTVCAASLRAFNHKDWRSGQAGGEEPKRNDQLFGIMPAMRILFAWELGRNHGHVGQFADVALKLHQRGHRLAFALRDPEVFAPLRPRFGDCPVLQAPHHPACAPPPGQPPFGPLFYPDELLNCGYHDTDTIAALIDRWQSLFEQFQPDLLVTQAAPTALLAARGREFPTAALGHGYDVPHLETPMPVFRHWEPYDKARLSQRERALLWRINSALQKRGITRLSTFADMLKADRTFLCTLAEFDHYPQRAAYPGHINYLGPIYKVDSGLEVKWNAGGRHRVFAYLHPTSNIFRPVMHGLLELPHDYDVVVAAPGISPPLAAGLRHPNLRIFDTAVRLDGLLDECDLGINHANPGTCCALVMRGKPVLMFPTQVEQLMFAHAVCKTGSGALLAGRPNGSRIRRAIEQLLECRECQRAAKRVARRYADLGNDRITTRIATDLEKLGGRPRQQPLGRPRFP